MKSRHVHSCLWSIDIDYLNRFEWQEYGLTEDIFYWIASSKTQILIFHLEFWSFSTPSTVLIVLIFILDYLISIRSQWSWKIESMIFIENMIQSEFQLYWLKVYDRVHESTFLTEKIRSWAGFLARSIQFWLEDLRSWLKIHDPG